LVGKAELLKAGLHHSTPVLMGRVVKHSAKKVIEENLMVLWLKVWQLKDSLNNIVAKAVSYQVIKIYIWVT